MDQKERIIEETMRMFVEQGIKSVRMDDIAQRLGMSKRTLYELFGDKEELLYLSMICYFDRKRESWEVQSAGARNVLEGMFMVLASVMDYADTTNRLLENLRKFYPKVYEKLMREGTQKDIECFRQMILEGIAEGLFVDSFNIDLAISVLYYTAGAIVERKGMVLPEGISDRDAFVQIITNFFRGISTAKGLALVDDCMKRYELNYK